MIFLGGEILDDFKFSIPISFSWLFYNRYFLTEQRNSGSFEQGLASYSHVSGLSCRGLTGAPWMPPYQAHCSSEKNVACGNKSVLLFLFSPWHVQPAMGWVKKKRTTMFHSSKKSTAAVTPQGQAFWTGKSWPSSALSFIWKRSCPSFCKHFLEMTTLPGWVFDFILMRKSTEYYS